MESRKVFKLFYHQEIGTAVLFELFRIALPNYSNSLLRIANERNKDNFDGVLSKMSLL